MATARSLVRSRPDYTTDEFTIGGIYREKNYARDIDTCAAITEAYLTAIYCIIHEELLFYKSARLFISQVVVLALLTFMKRL